MKKNESYTTQCVGYTEDGAGVCRIDDIVIFVPGLILGEEAEIGITKMKKTYGYGRILQVTKPSPHRIDPKCSVYRLCGGCSLQQMDYEAQKQFKEEKVRNCFQRNAHMDVNILPILTTEHIWNYRNKVQVPVQWTKGKVEMGFYRNHTNEIIPYENCDVQSILSNDITKEFQMLLKKYGGAKEVRHLLVKHAHRTDEVMVVMIVRHYPFDHVDKIVNELQAKFKEIVSFSAIINKREDNVILDGKEVLISGRPYIEEELLGKKFRISARSFYQINPYSTEVLYSTAKEFAQLTGKEIVIDLYCGTGTIGMIVSDQAKKVYGIEIVADAIKDAKINAEANNIKNIEFFNMDASKGANAILRSKIKADVVIVDPPRKGCSKDTLDAIVKINPKRIVYVSCDPATLARDVAILKESNYELQKVQPVDMFPQTPHVETVVSLHKRNDEND